MGKAVWIAKNQADLADAIGVSIATVANWARRGMPGEAGCYPIPLVITWARTQGPWSPKQKPEDGDPMLADGESPGLERYRLAKAEHAELDLQERHGELASVEVLRMAYGRAAVLLRKFGERIGKACGAEWTVELNQVIGECERLIDKPDSETSGQADLEVPLESGVGESSSSD